MVTVNATTHAPVPDVDYRASVLDPEGELVFQASGLAGADGFEYVTTSRAQTGECTMRVDAIKDGWRDHVELSFTVVPPAAATNGGPLFVSPNASASLETGQPARFPIAAEDGAGAPLTHGEVDVRLLDERGVPSFVGKLHVHENGALPLTVSPVAEGEHELQLLPQSLQPAPTPATYGEDVGQPPTFALDVAAAGDQAVPLGADSAELEPDETPAAGAWLGLAVLALTAAVTARRWR